ncbi:hypothetical protein [Nevskia sp.]|uniref:hypothetical protein n=1 Tax=Nevskia sp. TaxID=1929292 RepID=UPI003F6EC9A3
MDTNPATAYWHLGSDPKYWLAKGDADWDEMKALFRLAVAGTDPLRIEPAWKLYPVKLMSGHRGADKEFSGARFDTDRPAGEGGSIEQYFSRRAVEKLGSLLSDHGELLPVKSRMGEFFFFNSLRWVEGLIDLTRTRSEPSKMGPPPARYFPGQLYFEPAQKELPPIFRLQEVPISPLYVNGAFKRAVESAKPKLKGFRFYEVVPGVGYL